MENMRDYGTPGPPNHFRPPDDPIRHWSSRAHLAWAPSCNLLYLRIVFCASAGPCCREVPGVDASGTREGNCGHLCDHTDWPADIRADTRPSPHSAEPAITPTPSTGDLGHDCMASRKPARLEQRNGSPDPRMVGCAPEGHPA